MTDGAHTPLTRARSDQPANLPDHTAGPELAPAKPRRPSFTRHPIGPLEQAGSHQGELMRLDAQMTLREISILLGDVLDVLEEEQTILQAADELYEAAFAFQDARERRSTCVNITTRIVATRTEALHAALAGFRASLWSAKPSARARVRQLAW